MSDRYQIVRFLFWRRCYRLGIAMQRFREQCDISARDARRFAEAFSGGDEAERREVKG